MGFNLRTVTEYTDDRVRPTVVAWHFPRWGSTDPSMGIGPVAVARTASWVNTWWLGGLCGIGDRAVWTAERETLSDARRTACGGGNGRRYGGHTAIREVRHMSRIHAQALLWMPDNAFGWPPEKAWPNAGK